MDLITFKTLLFTLFFIGVWTHGDFCSINSCTGGIVMLGRRYCRELGGGGAANPSDLSLFFLHRFHPGVRVRGAGQVFYVFFLKKTLAAQM